jgi:integrase
MASFYRENYKCLDCNQIIKSKTCSFCGSENTRGYGRWGVRFRAEENGKSVNKNLTWFETQKEADNEQYKYISNISNNSNIINSNITFDQLFDIFIKYYKTTVSESSYPDMIHIYYAKLKPVFGDKKVAEITKKDVENFYDSLNEKKYAYKYKSKIRGYLFAICKYASAEFGIPNIVEKTYTFIKPPNNPYKIKFWIEEEFKQFIKLVDNQTYYTLFSFLYLTGCRKGEALALKWHNVNFDKQTIRVEKTLSRISGKDETGVSKSKYLLKQNPKTANGFREIVLPPNLVDILMKYKQHLILENKFNLDNFVFGGNEHLFYTTLQNRMESYIKKSKVKKIAVHDLRHSHVSLIINRYKTSNEFTNPLHLVMLIANRIGDRPEEVLKTYGHLFPNQQNQIIEAINFNF